MSKLPVIGRQLDNCDICGKKEHKINLVRTQVDFLSPSGSNYFPYSSYNSSGWTAAYGTDAGVISIGPYADRSRVRVADDNTSTEISGTQTWTVAAGFSTYAGHVLLYSSAIDISAWTSLTVSFDFGFYQQQQDQLDATVTCYVSNTDESNPTTVRRITQFAKSGRYWGTIDVADLAAAGITTSAARFYIAMRTYTGGEKVWLDRMQLEKDVTTMGTFIPTSGSSVDQTDTRSMTMRKVCGRCYEPLLSRTEQFNRRAEQRTDEPVTVWSQDF